MSKRSFLTVVAMTIVVTFLCNSCSNTTTSNTGQKTGARGGTLAYRLSAPPTTFNYLMAKDEASVITAFFLMQSRLVDLDHKTQKYVPALAESWKLADDGQTVDLRLRDGLKFSDGSDLTAEDVVFTLNAIYDEKTNSPVWKDAMTISGKPIAAKAVDKLNVQLAFPEKVAAVENYLINVGVLPSKILKKDLEAGRLAESWKIDAAPGGIVTSGAFVVESSTAGDKVMLARNPNYWRKDTAGVQLPYLDKISIDVIPDPNNTLARLQQNSLDIVDRLRPADFATLQSTPGGPIKPTDAGPGPSTDHLWFNLNDSVPSPKKDWFTDTRFRQAVSAAIDRETMTRSTLRGLATPLTGFVTPGNKAWVNSGLPKTAYSLERAAQLLNDAGFVKRGTPEAPELFDAKGNPVEFTLIVQIENEPRKLMAATIQEDLAKLGIKMQIAPIEGAKILDRWTKTFDYDAIFLGLALSDLEPASYASFLLSSGDGHQWKPNQKTPATEWEKQIDQLFGEQSREKDPQKRIEKFNEIQKIMADELPVIPIAARHILSASTTRVGNYNPSPIGPYSLWNADELFIY